MAIPELLLLTLGSSHGHHACTLWPTQGPVAATDVSVPHPHPHGPWCAMSTRHRREESRAVRVPSPLPLPIPFLLPLGSGHAQWGGWAPPQGQDSSFKQGDAPDNSGHTDLVENLQFVASLTNITLSGRDLGDREEEGCHQQPITPFLHKRTGRRWKQLSGPGGHQLGSGVSLCTRVLNSHRGSSLYSWARKGG